MATASRQRPRLAVTLGDPRGIGPEIVGKALRDEGVAALADYLVVGPTGTSVTPGDTIGTYSDPSDEATAGRLAGFAIERAATLALSGDVDGIVTAPIDKHALLAGGYDYPGHTEMLAQIAGVPTVMMLAGLPANGGHPLRVVLATTHIALRNVPDAIDAALLADVARHTSDGLRRWFAIGHPRLALCALNPHAGDGGRFGDEDQRILTPAARQAGLAGPFPADTVFVRAMKGEFDAVIAPYHDVGMTAIKVAAFGRAVNVTLGLPFPRTSPDHGTALDIAGRGIADAGSMIAAIRVCAEMVVRGRP